MPKAAITAVGHYLPDKVLTNRDLERMVDTTDDWIKSRTGIEERRIMTEGATSDMAVKACQKALNFRGMDPKQVDLIIVATVTPDMFFPSTACLVQQKLGASHAWGFDISGACSGFIFALVTATQFIENGSASCVLVVGADKISSIINYDDRATCVIFGDGAGAVLLEASKNNEGIIDFITFTDGSGGKHLNMKAGGSLHPPTHETINNNWHSVYQEGKEVFKCAVPKMAEVTMQLLGRNMLDVSDLDWLVPHQANMRIIEAVGKRLKIDPKRVMTNIQKVGNTVAASIPICLSQKFLNMDLVEGDKVILTSFGAGYTWGGVYLTWAI